MCASQTSSLDHEPLNLVLQGSDLVHEITCFVRGDACCNDGSANTTCAAKGSLAGDVYVWDVLSQKVSLWLRRRKRSKTNLIFAEKRKMQENCQRSGISCEDYNLRDTSVQGLGGLVRTFLQLSVMRRLLDEIEDFLGKGGIGDGPCGRSVLFVCHLECYEIWL